MSLCVPILPSYSPSAVVPSYSAQPGNDEQLIEQAPRAKSRAATGNYIKKSGRDTVILTEQDASAELPTYGRNAHIIGFVCVDDRELVSEVALKVKGKIEMSISERGTVTKTIVDETYPLWPCQNSSSSPCPSSVPFSAILPAKFADGDVEHPLPPSYNVSYSTSGGLHVNVHYTLSVVVTRARSRKLSFMSSKNSIAVRFNYAPRTRPSRPIQPPTSDFLADIKTMPDEWRQVSARGSSRPKSSLGALDIHLFIPAAEVFALSDTIPFSVQLTGPVDSVREFLPDPSAPSKTGISVTLMRKLTLDMYGCAEPCWVAAGHASTLTSTPPGASSASEPAGHASLDWAGALQCKAGLEVASFDAGVLKVQDFIVVDIHPPAGAKAQFSRLQLVRPVRLVTDSWPDEWPS
ncbi:hypothetical protein C8R43DRAFT_963047 [Mycena crocata]|nr:hypothetical protein C8R43DRAFT_963047 [Mycena crocata]